jgi:hypothetical protein
MTTALNSLFSIAGGWGPYLLAVAGLGTLTMAILQVLKDTTPIRRWFFKREMEHWLADQARAATTELDKAGNSVKVCGCDAEGVLLKLAADSDSQAFYSLEIEKLCGQWSAAAQIVAEYPTLYQNLFRCLAAQAAVTDQTILLNHDVPEIMSPHVEAQLAAEDQKLRTERKQRFADARNRVIHQIQRGIDSFQIRVAFRWQWRLRVVSFILSYALAVAALIVSGDKSIGPILVGAAIAGFLAPVARDLLAALQSLRD